MCGRYWIEPETLDAMERVVRDIDRKLRGQRFSGDIYPTNYAPVIEYRDNVMELACQKWGYPAYEKDGVIINARSETAMTKKMFRDGIRRHRIVIPAGGFYEWNKHREKNSFRRSGSPVMYMAGFCDYFKEEKRFVILTTAANESMIGVHHRMPLILEDDQIRDWLGDDRAAEDILHQTPALLERFSEYEQQTLF